MQKSRDKTFFYVIVFLIFITSSFDIFLCFDIGGFTFRCSQLLCVILFLFYIIKVSRTHTIKLPLGFKSLLIWVLFILLFTFNTVLPSINVGYNLWLMFNVLIILSFVGIINNEVEANRVIKLYILSFYIVAIIGILEFIIGVIGIDFPYITQWWVTGKIPRVNGFSYEPSYYATYLIIGWTMCRELLRRKADSETLKINLKKITFVITIAIILSSSRMGIALIALYESIIFLKNFLTGKNIKYVLSLIFLGITMIALFIPIISKYDFSFLLSGTGINGSSAHSVVQRNEQFYDIVDVFKQSPILGRGLGGIYAEIALNKGYDVYNIDVQKEATAISVFAEVLAASGIIGFIVFINYIFTIIKKPLSLSKKYCNVLANEILVALSKALIMELIILQFNQNILRIYLWLHIAVISLYYGVIYNKHIHEGGNENENFNC